jgi:hypothetical protein
MLGLLAGRVKLVATTTIDRQRRAEALVADVAELRVMDLDLDQ